MYLSYEEYQTMGGMLNETAFNEYEFEARNYIDLYTYNRLQDEIEIPDKVKECEFYLIKQIANQQALLNSASGDDTTSQSTNAGIASQSNDGVSISYNVLSAKELFDSSKDEVKNAINRYLQGVRNSLGKRLLYKGLYKDE